MYEVRSLLLFRFSLENTYVLRSASRRGAGLHEGTVRFTLCSLGLRYFLTGCKDAWIISGIVIMVG